MARRFGVALFVGVLLALLSPGLASAERPPYGPPEGASGPPVGGCPAEAGWFLVTPSGPEHLSAAYDFNGDGQVCVRLLPSSGIAFMDNAVR